MKKFFQILTKSLLFCFIAQPVMAQQWNEEMADKAYEFCERNGYFMTEAYIESKDYTVGVCSNSFPGFSHEVYGCYQAEKYFIVVKSNKDNKITKMSTWPSKSGKRFPSATYTFQSTLNGISYEIKTSGGSISVEHMNIKPWTLISFKKAGQVIYSDKVNYYYGNIGTGC